jgi:hypothetical protein
LVERVRSCGVEVIGPVALGSRFWSAYFCDNNGIGLELATSLADPQLGIVGSVLQTEDEARTELATLFDDPSVVEEYLKRMRLLSLVAGAQEIPGSLSGLALGHRVSKAKRRLPC